jgi:coenzyme F420-reducing hydrogenase alpha subunit
VLQSDLKNIFGRHKTRITEDKAKKRKRKLGKKVLKMAGKVKIHPRVHEELEKGRTGGH